MSVAKDLNASISENEEMPAQPAQSRSRMIFLLAFFVIILFELILIVIFMPKSATLPQNAVIAQNDPTVPMPPITLPIDTTGYKPGDLLEFPIVDPFNCMVTAEDPTEGGFMLRAKFSLKYDKTYKKFPELYDKVKNEIRASILTILRQSTVRDLHDPSCATIRRRIMQKINEILHEPMVKDVLVEDFSATPM